MVISLSGLYGLLMVEKICLPLGWFNISKPDLKHANKNGFHFQKSFEDILEIKSSHPRPTALVLHPYLELHAFVSERALCPAMTRMLWCIIVCTIQTSLTLRLNCNITSLPMSASIGSLSFVRRCLWTLGGVEIRGWKVEGGERERRERLHCWQCNTWGQLIFQWLL